MCDCFHLAFPNWHAASSGTGPGRRLRGPEPGAEDDSICDEPSQFTEGERPRPQGSSPVEEFPEIEKYSESECEAEHDPHHKSGSGKKTKKSGLGSMFEKRSTPKMSKLKEVPSPESGVIVKTAEDGCAEGLVYGGGGKEGIFIKQVVPESPASKSLKLKEGDQILSATVYFDNMSYEDAMQIMEHAQAYKMKLCLKRKPDITETEPAFESDVIPEDDIYPPEMREQGKTKRRGDARISWPKFPSFGKGKKSRFTRSHSSSEADEQRKLELSPTTSDTESPIKSQDALKGKKRHKLKLSSLKKRGRISSSEDQDTDTPTTGQISGKILQTHETSDMLSPECLESPSGETPEVYVTEGLKVMEDLRIEQNDQKFSEPQTVQHKVELITLDSTLKTEDLTVALAEKEISDTKSPDGKKKKKERSELKMKILGKDKSKKDTKAKSSPKRLKTLGASIEIPDQPVIPGDQLTLDANTKITTSESSKVISGKTVTTHKEMSVPKVELDISDVALTRKSSKEGEEKIKKDKDIKQKQEIKTGPTFKLPKIGFGDIATEETVQKIHVNVKESTTKIESTEVREDPYEQLSKSGLSRTQLPKREEIEIPGMEDMSRTKVKRPKEPKAGLKGHYEEHQAETVQMSIDVDSVKEAVSKLPGYKLPKVDMSGVPIPEDIIVIDANAQRISVKTPTKVVDTKKKHEAHFAEFDITASPEISKMTVKQPKITPDLTSEELIIETKVHVKTPEKKVIQTEVFKREDIIIPGKESIQEVTILQAQDKKSRKSKLTTASFGIAKPDIKIPDIGFDLPKQKISKQEGDIVKTKGTIFIQEVKTSETETRKGKGQIGGVISSVKVPEFDGIEYIDSVGDSPAKGDRLLTGFGVSLDVAKPNSDISTPEIRAEVKDVNAKDQTLKLPKSGAFTADITANISDVDKDMSMDAAEINTFEREGKGRKFKMPNIDISMPKVKGSRIDSSLSKKDVEVTLPGAKAEVKLPDFAKTDVTLENIHVSIPEQKMDVEKPEFEIKPLTTSELDVQGDKFKVSKFGIKTPKIKGPEFDLSVSKKDVKVPDATVEGKLPQTSEIDVNVGGSVVPIQQQKTMVKKAEVEIKPVPTDEELHGQGSRFKMPKLGITMPKVRGPEIDFSKSKKDVDGTLPEAKGEGQVPDVELKGPSAKVEIKAPELKGAAKEVEGSPSKFKMPTFKLPKFGVGSPNVSLEERDMDKDVKFDRADTDISVAVPTGKIEAPSTDFEGPSIDTETIASDHEGKGSMFKKPHFGFSMPKVKGPQINLSLSQKDVDVTAPDANVEVKLPEAPKVDVSLGRAEVILPEEDLEVKRPEIKMKHLQGEVELDGQGNKFKMPKLGMSMPKVKGPEIHFGLSKKDGDLALSEAKAGVKVTEVETEEPSADVEIKAPEIKVTAKGTEGSPSKFKMPSFKLPKFGVGTPNVSVKVPEVDKDVKIDGVDINIPEEGSVVNISTPNVDIECPSIDIKSTGTEMDGKGGKFKMPTLGFSMPKVKGPKVDLSLSKKDVDVTLPEAKTDVTVPEVDLGKVEVSIPEAKIDVPNANLEFNLPDEHKIPEMDPSEWEAEMDGHGGKFKTPKFGIKMPKVKGPEFDFSLSKKDRDVKSPGTKAGIKLPEVDLGKVDVSTPEAKMEVKTPELEMQSLQIKGELDGKEERFKMPKFGIKMPKGKVPEFDTDGIKLQAKVPDAPTLDVSLGKAEVLVPEVKAEVEKPELEIKPLQTEVEGQGSRFKVPTFGMAVPKVKGPEFHLGFSKKDVDVTLPEAKADVKLKESSATAEKAKVEVQKPEVEIKPLQTDYELGGQGGKFKMPTFGITMPKVKGPEIDFSLSKKDKDVRLPEAKAEVKLPEAPKIAMEMKAPECEAEIDGQEGKFKVPKFGISLPKVKGPDIDLSLSKKDENVTLPEAKVDVNLPDAELKEPSAKVEIKAAEIDASLSSMKGSPSKFKMPTFKFPKFGVGTPNISAEVPDKDVKIDGADVSISVPHTDVDVPKVKAEVHLPEVEVKEPSGGVVIDQQPGVELDAKMKKPRFSLPRFSFSKPSVKAPEVDVSLPDVNIAIPEGKVEIKGGEVDMKPPECEAEVDGQGSKFKMSKFGVTMPKVTGPEIDSSLSKKDVDVTLPEAKAEVNLPDIDLKEPSAEVKIKAPEIKLEKKDTKGSALKFKMPTFDLPKFGVGSPSATIEVPDTDKDVKTDGADIKIPEEVLTVDIAAPTIETEGPSIHMKITGPEHEGKGGKFKMPSLGFSGPTVKRPDIDFSLSEKDVDVTLPEAKAKVKLPEVELKEPSADVEVKAPEIKVTAKNTEGSPSKFKMPSFKLPKFGASIPSATIEVPDTDKDVKIDGADISISGPHTDVDVPDVKAGVHLPEVEVKEPTGGVVIDQQPGVELDAKMKKPRFSLPRFSFSKPSVKAPELDVSLPDVNVAIPEGKVEVKGGEVDMKPPACEAEVDGSKLKMPKFGITMPKVTGPEINLSLSKKDIDVTLPEAKAEVKLPDFDLKEPSAEVKIKAPEIKIEKKDTKGPPSKFKMPTFELPKLGAGIPNANAEVPNVDQDIKIDGADIKIPEKVLSVDMAAPSIEAEGPSIHMKTTGTEHEGKGSKFKMPSLGFSGPTVKRPDIDLSLSKKDVDVTLPEAKAEVQLPEVKLKEPSAEVEVKAPEIKVKTKNTEGSPSKFKMPSFKLPKFGAGTPSATIEVPDTNKDVKIDGADIEIPEEVLTVDITAPSIETEGPSIHMKMTGPEHEGKGGKFKMPSLGFSGPTVKRPDIDLSLSKKDVNVTLPEAKAEVKLPEGELKEPSAEVEVKAPEIKVKTKNTEGSPSKFKMPSFKLPKFGVGSPSATIEVPDTNKDVKIDGADIKIPEEVLTVDIAAPSIETEGPSIHMKTTGPDHEGKGGKFKMPSLGFSGPTVKRPDIDLSLSKKDVDVTLPEAKAEVKLPGVELKGPSAEVEVKAPEIMVKTKNTEGSPSKFKMPSFKLPKFGVSTPSATIEVPDTDKDVKIDGADIKIPEEVLTVDIAAPSIETEGPSIHMKTTGLEQEGKGSKFKMPSLGFSGPTVKRPDIDLSLSKKDVDVTLPEAKAEVKVPEVELKEPSAEVEVKAPEIKVKTKNTEGSPSKFKMPSFKLPKFGVGSPSATIEVPDTDKDVKIDGADIKIPEEVLTVDIAAPTIETEGPSIHMKMTGPEHEGKGGKFKMPSLGFSGPTVKRPDINLSLSKKDVDVTLPEAKATVEVPDTELKASSAKVEIKAPEIDVQMSNVDGSPSKFKMPTFKLPKFGATAPQVSVDVPDVDKDIKIDEAKLEVSKDKAKVDVTAPSIDKEGLSVDVKAKGDEVEGSGSKFKMPKFGISVPKVKGPEIDLSLSKKDTDVKLSEPKTEVQVPDVKVKQPSAKVEIKAQAGSVEGSPSKLKMPTFTLPKFGASTPKVSVEVPDVDKDIKIDGAKLEVSKEGATVDVTAPSINTEGLSVDMKAKGSEVEVSSSRFKMPKFGISMPKVQGPEIDVSLSKKDVDVTIPKAKAEVKLPKVKEPEGAISLPDAPTAEVESKVRRPSWAFPTFSFSRTSSKASDVDVNLETPRVDVTVPEAKAEVSLPDVEVQGPTGAISMEEPSAAELDPNLKKTKFSLPRLSFSKSGGKAPVVSAELPHVDVSLPEGEVVVKQPDVELRPAEGDVQIDGQGSKFKMPKFGISMPKVKGPEIDLSLSKKDAVVKLPEAKAEVQPPDVKMQQPSAKVEIKAPEIEAQAGNVIGSPSKLKMPTFTLPKFGASSAKVSVEVPDVDKDIKIDGAKLEVSKKGATVDVTAPSYDTEGLSVDVKAKGKELEETGSKFKMPKFGISLPKVQGPEIDLSLSKKDVDVTIPEGKAEVKLPKVKEPEGALPPQPDAPTIEVESKVRRPSWAFPTFSFSRTSSKASDVDVNIETPRVDVAVPEAEAEVSLPDVEVQGPTGAISMEEPPAAELDANLKKTKFSLPRLSFSKSGVKAPAVSAELPHVDASLPEGEVVVKQPDVELKPGEGDVQLEGQGSKFKMPKLGIDLKASQKKVDITLPEVEAEVKLPEIKVKSSASVKGSESDAKSKDVGGSPLKFKMPTMKMQKSGSATYDVTVETPDVDKAAETDGSKVKADVSVNIKGPSLDIKTDVSNAAVTDTDTPKTETDSVVLGSPSKFKLPSFKMPRMSFSKPKPEDEHVPVETESKEHQLKMEVEPKEEMKSPKMSLTNFGEILKNIDVEFDVSKADKEEVNLETPKDVHETDGPGGKLLEPKEKETSTKQETVKSPERTGWFKFPRFGLSSPSEPAKITEKDENKDEKSPAGETADEEPSPTCSIQSSDAFADISSAMTSEHAGLSLSSPTKVTVKYSDPTITTGLGETHSNVITSTTRTEVISVEPNLPEKITILSSGVSSSSEDTLQLASGKIHVITSNIQATPAAQQAKLLTDVQIQSAGDFPLKSESNEGASMTVEESPSGMRSLFGRHFFRETSSERSESKETIVITKQITHVIESSEPISGETASSIQRLRDSVHSDKMRFFDGAKK
ncbi:neuroblast differentiation-associated protein AHNAK [Sparus aurata]|uniref:neuroblast differentiation-associated protein AHNAK n=1 Tax=Sparus aurata TaxID=8175 RepID=UPI0011C0D97A|nr:neuroblast differentiation-associated protein AHNAK-like [Sparus aurata]